MKKGVVIILLIILFSISLLAFGVKQANAVCENYCPLLGGPEIMNCFFSSTGGPDCTSYMDGCCCVSTTCPNGGFCEGSPGGRCSSPCVVDTDCGPVTCTRMYYGGEDPPVGTLRIGVMTYPECNPPFCDFRTEACENFGPNYVCDPNAAEKGCYDSCAGITCGPDYCSGNIRNYNSQCSYGDCDYSTESCIYGCSNGACITCLEQKHDETCNGKDDDCDGIIDQGADGIAGSVCCAGVTCPNRCTGNLLEYNGQCLWGTCSYSTLSCGIDQYIGTTFCKDNDVYRVFRDYSCNAASATPCSYTDEERRVLDCQYICDNAICKVCIEGSEKSCNLQGVCSILKQTCVNNAWTPCPGRETIPSYQPTETFCDTLDNDCDGVTDEGCPCDIGTTRSCGYDTNGDGIINSNDNIGTCQTGTQQCLIGSVWGNCIGSFGPAQETCDNMDNNCNGLTDDGVQPRLCLLQQGVCTGAQQACSQGSWQTCDYGPDHESSEKSCDGLDNDCDGIVDNIKGTTNPITQTCGTDVGICQKGTQSCASGSWGTCGGNYIGPMAETCNNLDDDCDGRIDNGVLNSCIIDYTTCARYDTCSQCPLPPAEVCDGIDNNCNSQADEGCTCQNEDTRPCPIQQGVCAGSQQACLNQVWQTCDYGPDYQYPEINCDNKDNDCDGRTDNVRNTATPLNRECGTDEGICQKGTQACTSGTWGNCGGNYIGPMAETCNNLDDECDGRIDNGVLNSCINYATCSRYDTCSQCSLPPAETCGDGIDNNCNGQADEGCTCTGGDVRPCGTGNCAGTMSCSNNQWGECSSKNKDCGACCICDAGGSETYDDTQDADCTSVSCPQSGCGAGSCGTHIKGTYPSAVPGVCSALKSCISNGCAATCESDVDRDSYSASCGDCRDNDISVYLGAPELCDNKDNNCNSLIDENLLMPCGTDTGECKAGTKTCSNGVWGTACLNETKPKNEICNGLDDDCDTSIDEGCTCKDGTTQGCGSDIGECKKSTQLCLNGAWSSCVGEITAKTEICDGLDNDCDDKIDDDLVIYCPFFCGDKECGPYETCFLCPADCGDCAEVEPPTEPDSNGTTGLPNVFSVTMRNKILETRMLEIKEVDVRIKNNGNENLNNVNINLEVPSEWKSTGQVKIKQMKPKEIVDTSFKILVPFTLADSSVIKLNITSNEANGMQIIPVRISTPDFIVTPYPSFENYIYEDEVRLYIVVNNKKGTEQMSGLEIEFNLDKGLSTYHVDFFGPYDVPPGEIFLHPEPMSLAYLGGNLYDIHTTLTERGHKIGEYHTPLDLR